MVQIYNPNVVGKQILIDVKNIESDRLKTVEMTIDWFTCTLCVENEKIKSII